MPIKDDHLKHIPIGESDFKNLIEGNNYYVDKSLLIKEIIDDDSLVILLPRPRRFGKTLNMTMIRYFFEVSDEDRGDLFSGLAIENHPEIMKHAGRYPVIYITFKDFKYQNWEDALSKFKTLIAELYNHHHLALSVILNKTNEIIIQKILTLESDVATLGSSLKNLSHHLLSYYKTRPIILIDEYDTPLYAAWEHGYYTEMISFIRTLLGGCLKDNQYLEKAVLTGIMRIAKKSVFSDLNNLEVYTILDQNFSDKFGFLDDEVESLLRYYGIESKLPEVKEWYNGYRFGTYTIYNPWSILNYAKKGASGPEPYWVNTSSNTLIRNIIHQSDNVVKEDIQQLLSGQVIRKQIRNDFVLTDLDHSQTALYSFLLLSGYLTAVKVSNSLPAEYDLAIPNREVSYVYTEIISTWIEQFNVNGTYQKMLQDLTSGNIESFTDYFEAIVSSSFSYFDLSENKSENFYHAFVLGLFVSLRDMYELRSNRESGYGRYDLMLIPKNLGKRKNGFVIEFKQTNKRRSETLNSAADGALLQIKEKEYARELINLGIPDIFLIGIAFEGKRVKIVHERY
jgi:hypothetical protein